MKKILIYILCTITLTSCFDDDTLTGNIEPFALKIKVTDTDGNLVSNANVKLYNSSDDFLVAKNSFVSDQTNSEGTVTFNAQALGDDPAVYYFDVEDGDKRNWSSVTLTPLMLKTNGVTLVETTVTDVLPEFLILLSKTWVISSFVNGGKISGHPIPDCALDDTFVFLKSGRVIRTDAGIVCNPMRTASNEGTDWSAFSLNKDATAINMRDPEPNWFDIEFTGTEPGSGPNFMEDAPVTITKNEITITQPFFPRSVTFVPQ
ncbi:MAG: hypothetical protein N4A59_01145 [Marinifilum sp.]|jgi:hypothetical protein|nr:hypothetical protein [Marinifilum sp.]